MVISKVPVPAGLGIGFLHSTCVLTSYSAIRGLGSR